MPKRKRVQREHTEDWQTIQQYTLWPEQTTYELLRPVVLFGDPPIQRAQETGEPRTSLERKADAFDEQGMVSFFASRPRKQPQETARSLPPDMRQLIVDLGVEMPNMSIREIAEICDTRFQRRPSHHSIKMGLASGPPPSIQMRRFPLWDSTPDPAQRRHNIVQLHAEGWFVASIAEYLQVSKQTVYTTLKRWVQEGVKGLDDKSHARKAPCVVTLEVANEIRKKQENPLIGEWRMHAALLQEGIKVSPRTCERVMAKNRALYGWDKPKAPPKPKKGMPFKATQRHEFWSIDIRYIEHHQLPNIKGPIYVISILEYFSRMQLASAISEKQDTAAHPRMLASALRNYGAPEAIVTDSGGVFYSKRAMAIYEALDIRKERIDPRQSWQNYIEANFGIMRRLADFLPKQSLHAGRDEEKRIVNSFGTTIRKFHFAHRERNDNRHSPKDVLRGVLARTLPAPTLARIFFATEFTRHLDRSGYIRFRRWRFYAEEGLAKQQVQVSFYTSTRHRSNIRRRSWPSTQWSGRGDNKHIKEVKNPHLIETGYQFPQLKLRMLGPDEWLLFLKLPDYAARKKLRGVPGVIQLPLLDVDGNPQEATSSQFEEDHLTDRAYLPTASLV